MTNLNKFLEKIHYDSDNKCNISLLSNWFDIERGETCFNDRYFQIEEFIKAANDLSSIEMDDIYFSLNSFRKRHRTESDVWHLNAFAIDYDYYKIKKFKKCTAEEMYLNHIKPTLKYQPTFVIDSGRGLYIIYSFKHCSRVRKKLYKSIYKNLVKSQKQFGSDEKATLVTQVIRLPGTINSKNLKTVEIIEENDTNYDILDFVDILPYKLDEVKEYKSSRVKNKQARSFERSEPKSIKQRECTYFSDVYEDLKTLVKIRNEKGELDGFREYMLYLVRYMAMYYRNSSAESLNYALKLNNMLKNPMQEKDVINQCKPSKICSGVMSIKTIISKLEITVEEQIQLKTLISEEAKYIIHKKKKVSKRRNLKYLNRTEKEYQIYLRRDIVIKLKRKGWKNIKIAEELKVSKQLIACDLKYIKENAFEFIQKLEVILNELNAFKTVDNFTRYISRKFNKTLSEWLKFNEELLE